MNRVSIVRGLLGCLLMFFVHNTVVSQTAAGKIAGKVIDVDTGEPLVGANVLVVGTSLGAAANIEGEYVILNVVPGTYGIRVTFVGYQTQVIEGVRVVAGVTRTLDVKLKASAVEIGDIIIVAERKLFEEKATNDIRVYDSKQVENLPVKGVEKILSIQAGVVSAEGDGGVAGNATVNVRGGRGGEVLYVVDGVAQNDLYTGNNYSQVSTNAIEQVSFQIGGYEAKYGQAQSGIVNLTTKTGASSYNLFAEALSSTFTDDFDYNIYSGTLSGPIIPGISNHTIFLSAERGWFKDGVPSAIGVTIPSIGLNSKFLPNNEAAVWRLSGKTYHDLDFITLRLGANINLQDGRNYIHRYVKSNSQHNPRFERRNYSFNGRFSRPITKSSFFNINLGYRRFTQEEGDGVFFRNIEAYGDPKLNPELDPYYRSYLNREATPGSRVGLDSVGIFYANGRVSNLYTKTKNETFSGDIDVSAQIDNHLLEIGGGYNLNLLRRFEINPVALALGKRKADGVSDSLSFDERARNVRPFYFGYNVTGQRETAANEKDPVTNANIGARKPVIAYAYIQDRFELKDLVLNVGLRWDYFDTQADLLKDEALPFDPITREPLFERAKREVIFSPRIGIGFPVTPTTVFHAQFGKFVQQPKLNDVYADFFDIDNLKTDQNFGVNTGRLRSEETTQYELGFRQILGDNAAAMNITLFYKNTKNLVNTTTRFYQRQPGGQLLRYYGPSNADFGTVKGVGFTLNVSRLKNLYISLNYTFSLAEGTGSSTNSSLTAAFRNTNGEVPIVISPLDFDQRHTGTLNIGFSTGKGEFGILENFAASLLAVFSSGRPFTPLESQNLLAGSTNYGDTKGYVNSAYGPGNFSVSLKFEKSFLFDKFSISPYLWIENLFNATNPVKVYQSTGDPYTTGYLSTLEGQNTVKDANARGAPYNFYGSDYTAFERDPANFGIPRQIRLGMKVNLGDL